MIDQQLQDSRTKTNPNLQRFKNVDQIVKVQSNIFEKDQDNIEYDNLNNTYDNFNGQKLKNIKNINIMSEKERILSKLKNDQPSEFIKQIKENRLKTKNLNMLQQVQQNNKEQSELPSEDQYQRCSSSDEEEFMFQCTDKDRQQIILHIEEKINNIHFNDDTQDSQHNIPEIQQGIYHQQTVSNIFPQQTGYKKLNYQRKKQKRIFQKIISLKNNDKNLSKLTPIPSLKKYILKQLNYSDGKRNSAKISLYFYKLYSNQDNNIVYPIENQHNLQIIMNQKIKARQDIFIRLQHDGTIKKKVQKIISPTEFQAEFDSDGQLFSQNLDIQDQEQNQNQEFIKIRQILKQNKTDKQKYKLKQKVFCQFCSKSNKDIEGIKKCGPFYGPFMMKTNKLYVHFLCALWCYRVYLHKQGRILGVQRSVLQAKSKKCFYCQKNGAGLVCQTCNKKMHYQCVIGNCKFDWIQYKLKCNQCLDKIKQNEQYEQNKLQIQNEEEYSQPLNYVINEQQGVKMEIQQQKKQKNDQNKIQLQVLKNTQIQKQILPKIQKQQKSQRQSIIIPVNQSQLQIPKVKIENQQENQNTISLNKIKKISNQLVIDPQSRFEVHSESLQIIQSKCKAAKKNKIIVKQQPNQQKQDSSKKKNKGKPKKSK